MEVDVVLHLVVEILENDEVDVSSEVAYGCIQKLELVLHAKTLDVRAGCGVEPGSFASVGDVDMVHILHELGGFLLADILVKRASEIICDVILAIRECTCTAESAHDGAVLAVDAALDLVSVYGTLSLLQRLAHFEDRNLQVLVALHQLVGREDSAGTSPDNYDIISILFHVLQMYYSLALFSIALRALWCYYSPMRVSEYLCTNRYPGRIIAAGVTPSGKTVYAYAIMGRSPNSRNRIFRLEDSSLVTAPFDPSKVEDPSLIIYPAILESEGFTIVANGDQSLVIRTALENGKNLESAISECTFEPDAPNYTPRISLVIKPYAFEFAINRRLSDGSCERCIWRYPKVVGALRIIHTYEGDGNPLVSFKGEPRKLGVDDNCAMGIWKSLDSENRISLYVREGDSETIFNARESE